MNEGDPFFFKLRSPHNAIGGFGLYAGFAELAIWRAWDVFGQGNGTQDEHDLLTRLSANSARAPVLSGLERVIGCIA